MKKLQFLAILMTVFLVSSCKQNDQATKLADTDADAEKNKKAKMVKKRIYELLPKAMETAEVDAWLVLCRGIDNDPLADKIGGENVEETTAFVFYKDRVGFKSLALAPQSEVEALRKLKIQDKVIPVSEGGSAVIMAATFMLNMGMQKIAINSSKTNPMADGLSYSQRMYLEELFGEDKDRFVSSTELVNSWLSSELPK
jgi:hypothetical protein